MLCDTLSYSDRDSQVFPQTVAIKVVLDKEVGGAEYC